MITSSGLLWDTAQKDAIEKGNLVHHVMSLIQLKTDIDFAFDQLISQGMIEANHVPLLRPVVEQIVTHPQLTSYFTSEHIIYNEHDIISNEFGIIRPDRLMIGPNKTVTVIDYKTGKYQESHLQQLLKYKHVIDRMDLSTTKMILVYINDTIDIKEV